MQNQLKPFAGTDLTHDRKNDVCNGEEFLVARSSKPLSDALEKSIKNAVETIDGSALSTAISIIHGLCAVFSLIIVSAVLRSVLSNRVSLTQAYENAPFLFWVGGVCIVVWAILSAVGYKKEKSVEESGEYDYVLSGINSNAENIIAELNVPPDALDVDIFELTYKIKKGVVKPKTKRFETTAWSNIEYKAFADSQNLYLVSALGKYCFSRASLRGIHSVKETVVLPYWNKNEETGDKKYKKYKLRVYANGRIYMKRYYILEIERSGEVWGIYFPNYELPAFEELTGLTASGE